MPVKKVIMADLTKESMAGAAPALIDKLLSKDPRSRCTLTNAKAHPWYNTGRFFYHAPILSEAETRCVEIFRQDIANILNPARTQNDF